MAILELKEELQYSVDHGFAGFEVFYQPQVCSHSFALHGAEALLRYTSPRRGSVSPVEFVPLLEDTRLIFRVGLWVLSTALEQCRIWRQTIPKFSMSVNVAHVQLTQEDITEQVLRCLQRSGLPGDALTLELTEGAQLLDSPHINEIFSQWKQRGIAISIDDFGTGYSSLSRLEEMAIDEVKIDRCFVRDIHKSAYNYRFLGNMLQLADSSRIRVCCEGIETVEELAALEELQPGLLQGFLFSKPCSARDFTARYLDKSSPVYRAREAEENEFRRIIHNYDQVPVTELSQAELAQAILNAADDILYISDPETYELYYLNPAGQRLFGLRDYRGKKCYKALEGRKTPCEYCQNQHLDTNQFYIHDHVNEYCGRHFILRDKLILLHGRSFRLGIATDITEQEFTSQNVQDRLDSANHMVDAAEQITACARYADAANLALSLLGTFYQADRVFLYEPPSEEDGMWRTVTKWENPALPHRDPSLYQIPSHPLQRWVEQFRRGQTVIILGSGPLQTAEELALLQERDIHQHIAVPLLYGEKLMGFIGVSNPHHCIHDDSMTRLVGSMLVSRMSQEQARKRLHRLSCSNYRAILRTMSIGLWIIRFPPNNQPPQMLADEAMYRVLGAPDFLTPEECYQFWYTRINDGYYNYVHDAVQAILNLEQEVQLEYTWNHPTMGNVIVQCTGIRTQNDGDTVCIQGYHRIISNTQCPRFLPDAEPRDLFEYNELTHTIFFHTQRHLIAGEQRHESDFPQCWIDAQIVHPHYAQEFRAAFSRVCLKTDLVLPEILLKAKGGGYEWFQLLLRHPGQEEVDLNTVVASVEPAGSQRTVQLESLRIQRFYHAMLADTLAYAEVDLKSGQPLSVGGIWQELALERQPDAPHFVCVLRQWLLPYLPPQQLELLEECCRWQPQNPLSDGDSMSRRICFSMPVDNSPCQVRLTLNLFQEVTTQDTYALFCLRSCRKPTGSVD